MKTTGGKWLMSKIVKKKNMFFFLICTIKLNRLVKTELKNSDFYYFFLVIFMYGYPYVLFDLT